MAKKSTVERNLRRIKLQEAIQANKLIPVKRVIQVRNRCNMCSRPRGFMRKFGLCRICFREQALKGNLPGVVKSSW